MSAALDYLAGGEAGYTGMPGDRTDSAQMQPFAADASRPWWESLVTYGVTRAIDNRFGPTNVQGNTQPGSFAGTNGRTYTNAPRAAGGQAVEGFGLSPLMMLAIGAAVVLLIAKS